MRVEEGERERRDIREGEDGTREGDGREESEGEGVV